jgi:RP/EB family microtubule-associated protein
MQRVNWEAKSDYEFIQNYKLLQAAFNKHHVQRHIDVDRLVRAKYQDNLEFCQWLKAFFDQSGAHRDDYDPGERRAKGKGAKGVSGFLSKTASSHNSKPLPTQSRSRTTAARPTTARPTTAMLSSGAVRSSQTQKENKRTHPSKTDYKTDAIIADATLMKKNSDLNAKLAEMEVAYAEAEKERDFYFEKLRDVEVMLQVHEEKGESKDPERLVENIFKVLYATVEDKYAVDDEGEFVKGGAPDGILDELLTDE